MKKKIYVCFSILAFVHTAYILLLTSTKLIVDDLFKR